MKTMDRLGNIDLLRVLCIFFIVMYHMCIYSEFTIVDFSINKVFIDAFSSTGKLASNILFLLSGYFMYNSKIKYKKIVEIVIKIELISIICLAITCIFVKDATLSLIDVIRSFMPLTFENYWFITYYIIIYFVSPLLKKIVDFEKNEIYKYFVFFVIIWVLIPTLTYSGTFGYSGLVYESFIFMIGMHIKKKSIRLTTKKEFLVAIVAFCSVFFMPLFFSCIGQVVPFFYEHNLYFSKANSINVFIATILIPVAFISLSDRLLISNNIISYVAKSTLVIYVLHDNFWVRKYMWKAINLKLFQYDSIFPIYLVFVCCGIVVIGTIIDLVLDVLVRRVTERCVKTY